MAISLNGAGWYTRASLFVAANPFTVAGWAMPTTLPGTNVWHNLFGMQTSFCATIRQPSGGGGAFWSVGTATTDNDSTVFPTANVWYHVALTRRGSAIKLYVNGVLVVDATDATAGATGFIIGDIDANNNGDEFIGRLAAVKVWARDLSRNEVLAEMKQYVPVSRKALAAFYPLRRLADDENEFYRALPLTVGGTGHADADGPPVGFESAPRQSRAARWIQTAGGTTFTASLAGSVTPSGALTKQANKALAGSATPSGAIAKQAQKPLAGTSTSTGALAKLASKPFAGSSTPAGAITRLAGKGVAGSVAASGAIANAAAKALAGSATAGGAIAKLVSKPLAGSVTPSGALALIKVVLMTLSGSVTASGALAKSVGKSVAGSVTPVGSLVKSCAKALAGTVTAAGALAKQAQKALSGSSTPAGALTRLVGKGLSGAVTPAGTLAKAVSKALSGSVTASGVLSLVGGVAAAVTHVMAHLLGLDEPTLRRGGLNEPTLRADGEDDATIRRKGIDE